MKSDAMSGGYLLQLVLGLIIVVICIVALAWFAKKMNRFQSSTDDSLKIIGGISMGSRERVVLLQVGEEQLLIGVSPGRINTLHVLATPLDTNTNHSAGPLGEKILGEKFSDKLKTMMADAGTASVKKKNKQ